MSGRERGRLGEAGAGRGRVGWLLLLDETGRGRRKGRWDTVRQDTRRQGMEWRSRVRQGRTQKDREEQGKAVLNKTKRKELCKKEEV